VKIVREHMLDEGEARRAGYSMLAGCYGPNEDWMLANVIGDMASGGIDFCIVLVMGLPSVWRKHMKRISA